MAKLFYTLEETAEKLGKTTDEITALVAAGKLREFRDHEDKLMFKIQEVDLLGGDSAGSLGGLDLSGDFAPTGSDVLDLGSEGSGAPMLDLDGSGSPPAAASGAMKIEQDEPPTLELDDFSLEDEKPAAPAPNRAKEVPFELDDGPSKPAAEETFALDFDDSAASAPKAGGSSPGRPAAPTDATLELEHDDGPLLSSPAAPSSALADSLGSVVAAKAASGAGATELEGSDIGVTPDGSSISDRIGIDGASSGSGLMDLTNESESSSIGAALMDEAFATEEAGELPANASGIFGGTEGGESGAGMAAVGAVAGAAAAGAAKGKGSAPIFTSGPAATEAYSGSWSGVGVGLLLPASLGLGAAAAMVAAKAIGAPTDLATMYAENWTMYTGILAGAIAASGVIGFFVGKATE